MKRSYNMDSQMRQINEFFRLNRAVNIGLQKPKTLMEKQREFESKKLRRQNIKQF